MSIYRRVAAAFLFCGFLLPAPLLAHTPNPGLEGFWQGVFFPYLSVVPALCSFGIGFVIARLEKPALVQAGLSAFVAALVGASLLASFVALCPSGVVIGVGLCLVGAAMIRPAASRWALALVTVCAVCPGILLGIELYPVAFPLPFYVGSLVGSLVAVSLSIHLWRELFRPWFTIAIRILGSWLVAIGLMLLAASF